MRGCRSSLRAAAGGIIAALLCGCTSYDDVIASCGDGPAIGACASLEAGDPAMDAGQDGLPTTTAIMPGIPAREVADTGSPPLDAADPDGSPDAGAPNGRTERGWDGGRWSPPRPPSGCPFFPPPSGTPCPYPVACSYEALECGCLGGRWFCELEPGQMPHRNPCPPDKPIAMSWCPGLEGIRCPYGPAACSCRFGQWLCGP